MHGGILEDHFGVTMTLETLRQWFYWVGYRGNVKDWYRKCVECAVNKGSRTRRCDVMTLCLPFKGLQSKSHDFFRGTTLRQLDELLKKRSKF